MAAGETFIDYMPNVRLEGGGEPLLLVLTSEALYMLRTADRYKHGARLPLTLINEVSFVGAALVLQAGTSRHHLESTAPGGRWMKFDERLAHWLELADPYVEGETDLPTTW